MLMVRYVLPDGTSRPGAVLVIPCRGDVCHFGALRARVAERWLLEPAVWTLVLTPMGGSPEEWAAEGFCTPEALSAVPPWREVGS